MAEKNPILVPFHYLKSNHFRVIHVDGAIGGVTPRLLIQMGLYSERLPIPKNQVFAVTDAGTLSDPPVKSDTREGIVREVEAEILMDVNAARALADWLNDQVKKAEVLITAAKQ